MKRIALLPLTALLLLGLGNPADAYSRRDAAWAEQDVIGAYTSAPIKIVEKGKTSDSAKTQPAKQETAKTKPQTLTVTLIEPYKSSYLTGNEYDEPDPAGSGMQIIRNHKYSGTYDIYFKAEQRGTSQSIQISQKYIGADMQEILTATGPDGVTRSATRANWYKLFDALDLLTRNNTAMPYDFAPEIYEQYFAYEKGQSEAESIANAYINYVYFPSLAKKGLNQ